MTLFLRGPRLFAELPTWDATARARRCPATCAPSFATCGAVRAVYTACKVCRARAARPPRSRAGAPLLVHASFNLRASECDSTSRAQHQRRGGDKDACQHRRSGNASLSTLRAQRSASSEQLPRSEPLADLECDNVGFEARPRRGGTQDHRHEGRRMSTLRRCGCLGRLQVLMLDARGPSLFPFPSLFTHSHSSASLSPRTSTFSRPPKGTGTL